jgi:hypothetical protein
MTKKISRYSLPIQEIALRGKAAYRYFLLTQTKVAARSAATFVWGFMY